MTRFFSDQWQGHTLSPPMVAAMREVERSDGVVIDPVNKAKNLRKFGRRTDVGTTKVTVASLAGEGDEIYLSSNGITHVVSSNAGDTGEMKVEYHTISGTDLTFGVQSVTLAGQTPVALTTPSARVSRMYNNTGTNFVGDIYAYEGGTVTAGVPDTATEVHAQIPAGFNNTFKASTSISSVDYYLITEFHGNLQGSNTARVEMDLEIATGGRVFLEAFESGLGTAGNTSSFITFDPYIIVRPNSEIRVQAQSTASGTVVSTYFAGYLATAL